MLGVTERRGECPVSDEVGMAIHECDSDMECESPKKCCTVGIGQVCRDPVFGEFIYYYTHNLLLSGVCVCACVHL